MKRSRSSSAKRRRFFRQEEGGIPELVPPVAAFDRGGVSGTDELGSGDGFEKQQVARLWGV